MKVGCCYVAVVYYCNNKQQLTVLGPPCRLTDRVAADNDRWFVQQAVNDVNYSIRRPEISTYHSSTLTESTQTKYQLITLQNKKTQLKSTLEKS